MWRFVATIKLAEGLWGAHQINSSVVQSIAQECPCSERKDVGLNPRGVRHDFLSSNSRRSTGKVYSAFTINENSPLRSWETPTSHEVVGVRPAPLPVKINRFHNATCDPFGDNAARSCTIYAAWLQHWLLNSGRSVVSVFFTLSM